ncbi:MAG TPA: DEAD/DEAH box helicase, partial [Candidatus Nitrosotenuis sp.]|nr:DEAD/DEAH box helicase [Candidatus Nitrosotenuis sp.]
MALAAGSLVRARGREWVVQPESRPELLLLRPLGGTQDEVTGILPELEKVEPARFDWPDPSRVGDHRTCRLLREAVRLGFRSSTGPFRCLARLAFEPRPYQLVPLLMALKLDPVRLLIADDVGVGKTIEALLVARELLDRGEARGLAVLCPPHLAEQWQAEMSHKFHLEAELVLPGTVGRLERGLPPRRGLFEHYPCTVVSTDFIKADRHRLEFLRTCPDLVIVDEAHTCVDAGGRARHQRYDLVSSLAADPRRHLLLVTATPHSGKEDAFRTLLALLHRDFAGLPEDLSGPQAEPLRRRLAGQLVQRRRGDLRRYLEAETPFPQRQEAEQTYSWSPAYRRFFEEVLDYARQRVADPSAPAGHRQRLRWWSMLALLRSVASSPAAAAATLRTRASVADTTSDEEADEIGRRTVLDLVDEDTAEASDLVPGSDLGEEEAGPRHPRGRMAELARQAEALQGQNDPKLEALVPQVRKLLDEGFH